MLGNGVGGEAPVGGEASSPHHSAFPFILVDAGLGREGEGFDFQSGGPLGSIEVFAARFGALGGPTETEVAGCGLGQTEGIAVVGVLPTLTWRHKLLDGAERLSVVACFYEQALGLHIVARRHDEKRAHGLGLVERIVDVARLLRAETAFLLLWNGARNLGRRQWLVVGHGKDRNVFVIAIVAEMCLGQLEGLLLVGTGDDRVGPHHLLHRLLGRNPRSAGKGKAVADVDAQLQTERVGLGQGIVNHLPEARRELLSIAAIFGPLAGAADGHEVTTAKPHIVHGLQVGLDAVFADGAVHPVPERPWLGIGKGSCPYS